MPRKGHKKSRHGCVECKRRHVKCDETPGPTCVNCKTANTKCSYSSQPRATTTSAAASPAINSTSTRSHTHSVEPDFDSNVVGNIVNIHTPPAHPINSNAVNLDHLELFHNFSTEVYKSFTIGDSIASRYQQVAVKTGLKYPFLMHELLAISALHLSIHRPERSAFYRGHAAALQSLAVQGCNDALQNVDDENCVAVFIFASMMGMHSFCDTFTYRDGDFNNFLDKLTRSINLLRGVRTVTHEHWETLRRSDLAELIAAGSVLQEGSGVSKQECQPLMELVQNADVSETSLHAYENAISQLQRVFNAEHLVDSGQGTMSMLYAWLVTSDAVYTDLLTQRRPEALIILAYYAVILHHRRAAWAVQDAGAFLIDSISQYLGNHWARWLQWPNDVVHGTPDDSIFGTAREIFQPDV